MLREGIVLHRNVIIQGVRPFNKIQSNTPSHQYGTGSRHTTTLTGVEGIHIIKTVCVEKLCVFEEIDFSSIRVLLCALNQELRIPLQLQEQV